MEYCAYGTLKKPKINLNDNQKLLMLSDAAKGIDQLHNLNFVHRDIAARNILICYNKSCYYNSNNIIGKITDFGLTREINSNGNYYNNKEVLLPVKYLYPSIFKEFKFNKFTDTWSFGCTIYETLVDDLYKNIDIKDIEKNITNENFDFFTYNKINNNDNLRNFIKVFLDYAKRQNQYSTLYRLFNNNINLLTFDNIEDIRHEDYDDTLSKYFKEKKNS